MKSVFVVLWCWLQATFCAHQSFGRALSCRSRTNIANVRVPFFAESKSPEVRKLQDNGITVSVWLKFTFNKLSTVTAPFSINHKREVVYLVPFAGDAGGWVFGGETLPMVKSVARSDEWHHYALSYDVRTGDLQPYVDGEPLGNPVAVTSGVPVDADMKLTMCTSCSVPEYKNPVDYTSCVSDIAMDGEIDDLAIWGRALSVSEMRERWNVSLTSRLRSQLEPDLVFFYDFDNVSAAEQGFVLNLGTGGEDFDLMLGQSTSKLIDEHRYKFKDESLAYALIDATPPTLIPSGASPIKPSNPDGPIVLVLGAGETASVTTLDGEQLNVTAPNPFTERVHLTTQVNGRSIVIELQPVTAPIGPTTPGWLERAGVEDGPIAIPLYASTRDGLASRPELTSLPARGKLYLIQNEVDTLNRESPLTSIGQRLNATRHGFWVAYVPPADGFGIDIDQFSYKYTLDEHSVESANVVIHITLRSVNDFPFAQAGNITFYEDPPLFSVHIDLKYSDQEINSPIAAVVSRLPTKGTLYAYDANSTLRPILSPYNVFDVGTPKSQYLSKITKISSFWGARPPYVGYHPLNMLGPPDSSTYGEGVTDGDWVSNLDVFPPIGQRVLYPGAAGLLAFVRAIDHGSKTLLIEFAKMYKLDGDGELRQCHMPPDSSLLFPSDCDFALVPESGIVTAVVPRDSIGSITAAVWSPLQKAYVGNYTMRGGQYETGEFRHPPLTRNRMPVGRLIASLLARSLRCRVRVRLQPGRGVRR